MQKEKETKPEPTDDYDPHDYREVAKPTKNWQAFTHFLKAAIGTGVLAMPNAFANSGYINGVVFSVFLGVICLYCLHLLIGSMYILCKRHREPYITYSHSMKLGFLEGPKCLHCLSHIAVFFVDGFLALYHYGICCVYVVFIAATIKQFGDKYWTILDVRIYMCMLVIPLILIFSIRNLRFLAPFSTAANILVLIGFAIVLYYICRALPALSSRNPVVHIYQFPVFFGTVLFALEAVGVILAIEEQMEKPKDYVKPFGIMNMAMTIVLLLYIIIGFLGYWKYGDACRGSVTLNIPEYEILSQCTKVLFAVATYISYALQGYVMVHIIWDTYLSKRVKNPNRLTLYELLFRAMLVILTFLAAVAVPDLSLSLSLVGSFCLSILGIVFPALLQVCVLYSVGYGKYKYKLVLDMFLIIFGILGCIVGTGTAIRDIVVSVRGH